MAISAVWLGVGQVGEATVGRDRELAVLTSALAAVRHTPTACVIHGVPGIGKTALWADAVAACESRGYLVLSGRPAESEAMLSFVGLGDLLGRVPDQVVQGLRSPQRRGLRAALLQTDDPVPDHRAVRVAVLEVVRRLASSHPVVIAIDDAQWLDPPTAAAVEHVVRRLRDERVGLLVAIRSEYGDLLPFGIEQALPPDRTTRVGLAGLGLAALHHLIRARTGLALSRPELRQVEQVTGGNPGHALEVARLLARTGRQPRPGEPLPVPDSLHLLVAERVRRLPPLVRAVTELVAALRQPTVAVVRAALPAPSDPDPLAAAEESGIIEVQDGRIRFTHPWFAAVVGRAMSGARRRQLHTRLAAVVGDLEQRAWHLALAAEGPDPAVAAALADAAGQAQDRGALSSAAQLWELAALRTADPQSAQRHLRAAAAGVCLFHAGDAARGRALLESAVAGLAAGHDRAGTLLELADVVFHQGCARQASELCEQALAEAGPDRLVRIVALVRGAWYGTHDVPGQLRRIDAAAQLLRDEDIADDPELYAVVTLMRADHRFHNGLGYDRRQLRWAGSLVRPDSLSWKADWARMTWRSMSKILDPAAARSAYADEYELFSAVGDEPAMGTLSTHLAELDCWLGHWHQARRHATRSIEILQQSGARRWSGFALYASGLVDAHLGQLGPAREAAREGLELAAADPWVSALHLGLLGFAALSEGDPETADRWLTRAADLVDAMRLAEPARHRFQGDQVEAAVALGDLDRADRLLDRLQRRVAAAPYPWLLAVTARCQGLLLAARGDLDGAATALARAVREHERLPIPFERARTQLAQGRLLRRRKAKLASRQAVLAAQQTFEELGAPLWRAQAAAELRRLGLRRGTIGELTPTEERIARLVAGGLTNREVAATAYVTPKTVEANLSRIYRKLGVASRRELARLDVLRSGESVGQL